MKIFVTIFLAHMISIHITAQKNSFNIAKPAVLGISIDSLKKMNDYFHSLVDNDSLAGIQTGIVCKGQLIHFDSYGCANIDEKNALNEESIFRIFSMTKPIVSVALMQLYEKGKFKLRDPLYKYIPSFRDMQIYSDSAFIQAERPIFILDLLRHTSGFGYGRSQYEELNHIYAASNLHASQTNEEFVHKLSSLPLSFEPGTNWEYGFSTNICGYLVEVFSGMTLDRYLKENVFTPLGMNDTHFQLPKNKIDRFTVGYGWNEDSGMFIAENQCENRYTENVTLFNGGGGLVSTTLDYLRFCQMILNGGLLGKQRILEAETIDLMLQNHLQEVRQYQERLRLPLGEYGFGLGFAIRGKNETELEKVYGWGGAVGTYFKIDVENDLAYVLMIQLSPYRHLGLRQSFQDFVESSIAE